jgi:fluoroquinolone resistance protein
MDSLMDSQAHYADLTFKAVQLEQGEFVSSEFHDCVFVRCRFAGTTFRLCRFVNCRFRRCDLNLVQVPNSTFSLVHFEDSTVIGVDWTQADWSSAGLGDPLGFTNSAINHSTFIGLRLSGMSLTDSIARDVDFREADLSRSDFCGTDLAESMFLKTDLTKADLSTARNYQIDPGQNTLTGAKFSLPEAMSLLHSMDIELVDGV